MHLLLSAIHVLFTMTANKNSNHNNNHNHINVRSSSPSLSSQAMLVVGDNNDDNPIFFPPKLCCDNDVIQEFDRNDNYNDDNEGIIISQSQQQQQQQQLRQGTTFEEACQFAVETHRTLFLLQDIKDLPDTILLRKREHLTIRGGRGIIQEESSKQEEKQPSSSSSSPSSSSSSIRKKRIQISGKIHNLFLLNNHSKLTLHDIELVHEDVDDVGSQVGAAVNLRYKSSTKITNCSIISHAGFCCWAVQKSSIDLNQCYLHSPLRSALVCFGNAKLLTNECTIMESGVHGVCARGECQIKLINTSILNSAVRGLYAYANASVDLHGCTVSGTCREDMAAIEVSSAVKTTASIITTPPTPSSSSTSDSRNNSNNNKKTNDKYNIIIQQQKTSSLIMNGCNVVDNSGVGVRIRGGVRHNLIMKESESKSKSESILPCSNNNNSNNIIQNLGGDDIDFRLSSAEEEEGKEDDNSTNNNHHQSNQQQPQRDSSGSSFRKGDWWCPNCIPKRIIQGSNDSCTFCKIEKKHDNLLTTDEVLKLNRGEHVASQVLEKVVSPTWWFDADGDVGYIPYDVESSQKLEDAFQALHLDSTTTTTAKEKEDQQLNNRIVMLSGGRYSVDVQTMEQINIESQFLRLVQRREKKIEMNEKPKTAKYI